MSYKHGITKQAWRLCVYDSSRTSIDIQKKIMILQTKPIIPQNYYWMAVGFNYKYKQGRIYIEPNTKPNEAWISPAICIDNYDKNHSTMYIISFETDGMSYRDNKFIVPNYLVHDTKKPALDCAYLLLEEIYKRKQEDEWFEKAEKFFELAKIAFHLSEIVTGHAYLIPAMSILGDIVQMMTHKYSH